MTTNRDALGPWENATLASGRYQRLQTIGVGGMGYVYRATDARLKTDVVIKAPRPTFVPGSKETQLFEQEIGVLIQLSFPHIVPVIDVGRHDGVAYAVMRYLPGGSLASRIPKGNDGRALPMTWQSMKDWLPSIVKALDFIHRAKYVHRDVKPQNILFDAHGEAYLSDFGIARFIGDVVGAERKPRTGADFALGTVDYMAPELLRGLPFDGRADQYALAVTVYEVLSGRLPFEGDRPEAVIEGHLRHTPQSLSRFVGGLPPGLGEALSRALAKRPEDRFATCTEFGRSLVGAAQVAASKAVSSMLPTPSSPSMPAVPVRDERPTARAAVAPPPQPQARRSSKRKAYVVAAAGVMLVLAGASIKLALDSSSGRASLGVDHLPRKMSEWKQKAGEVEKAVVIDAGPLLKKSEYADAAEFEKMMAAQAAEPLQAAAKSLESLTADLKAMAVDHGERSRRLAELREKRSKESVDAGELENEQRRLGEQESQLVSLAGQLKTLQLAVQSPRGAYPAEAVAELTALREMEAVCASNEPASVSSATLERAVKLTTARSPALSFRALNVLARSPDSRGTEFAAARFDFIPLQRQAELVWSLLLSGQSKAVEAALRQAERSPHAFAAVDRAALWKLVASKPAVYQPFFPLLVKNCHTSDERLQLANAQAEVMQPAWQESLETEFREGLLKGRAGEFVAEVIRGRRAAAYSFTERLLAQHRESKLDLNGDEAAGVAAQSPTLAATLMEHWILRGTTSQRTWSLESFGRSDSPLTSERLHAALRQETVMDPASLVNLLLPRTGAKFAELTERVLTDVRDIPASETAYASASADVLQRPSARNAVYLVAWENRPDGPAWVMRQILGPDFDKHFAAAETNRERQLKMLRATTAVLNGKLVKPPGATVSKTASFLQISAREFPNLPSDVDPTGSAPDSDAFKHIAEMQRLLSEAEKTTAEPYRATLAAIRGYVDELQQLTAVAHAIGGIYDLTIVKQLPGALREMKTSLVTSWDFRFPTTAVESFRREDARYQSLSLSLPKLRAAIPWSSEPPPPRDDAKSS